MALTTRNHDRDSAGLKYVYPVLSRRSRGLSVGINLNPNNACNFRCVYCQVPGLTFGKAPKIDRPLLIGELHQLLEEVVHGEYLERNAPVELRRLNDIAFSGNGEPTSAEDFDEIVQEVKETMREFDLLGTIRVVIITNGSLIHRDPVRRALEVLQPIGGEVWFKVDSATAEGQRLVNNHQIEPEKIRRNLALSCRLCPTWLQTCVFAIDGEPPQESERVAYLDLLRWTQEQELPLGGVQLYGLARPSCQPEAPRLEPVESEWVEAWARRIRDLGVEVRVSL